MITPGPAKSPSVTSAQFPHQVQALASTTRPPARPPRGIAWMHASPARGYHTYWRRTKFPHGDALRSEHNNPPDGNVLADDQLRRPLWMGYPPPHSGCAAVGGGSRYPLLPPPPTLPHLPPPQEPPLPGDFPWRLPLVAVAGGGGSGNRPPRAGDEHKPRLRVRDEDAVEREKKKKGASCGYSKKAGTQDAPGGNSACVSFKANGGSGQGRPMRWPRNQRWQRRVSSAAVAALAAKAAAATAAAAAEEAATAAVVASAAATTAVVATITKRNK